MREAEGFLVPGWNAPPKVRAVSTTRAMPGVSAAPFHHFNLGSNSGDDPHAVAENRRRLVELAQLPSPPHWLKQVHGVEVLRFDAPPEPDAASITIPDSQAPLPSNQEADASITSAPGVVLAILTADCLPVLFASKTGDEIAAAHAGWRGLAAGVLEATVAAMRTPPNELIAWLGPAASSECYEIGAEVRDAFLAHDAISGRHFIPTRENHFRIDLFALARDRLTAAGVAQIHGGGLCTMSDAERFYSYRRDGRTGRQAALIWINP